MRPRSSPQNWPLRSRGAGKRTRRDILRALVIGLDRWLRRRQGIVAFCQDPDCLLRISKATAPVTTVLSDGIRVNAGDPIIELHFWNERLPRLPEGGVGLRWALWAGHRFARSLELLADHVVKDVRLSQVVALRSETIFTTADNGRALAGVARHLGFDVCEMPRSGPRAGLMNWGKGLLSWALVWAFNPHAAGRRTLLRRPLSVWMSRETLLSRYRDDGFGR